MKFTTIFSTLAGFLAILSVSASPAFPLEARSPNALPSLLQRRGTFYRAITGKELATATSTYKKGSHPATHASMEGDFSHTGGLYVFVDINEAKTWGSCWAKVQPKKENMKWYLVKFTYTPASNLKTKSFQTADSNWLNFVHASYKGPGAKYDIVEGPVSVGHGDRLQAFLGTDKQMVWQAAFIGHNALQTLVVDDITLHDEKAGNTRNCCTDCNVM